MTARCADCRWLERRADRLEARLGGWRVLSSADASVRGDDGLCLRHDRLVASGGGCAAFAFDGDHGGVSGAALTPGG